MIKNSLLLGLIVKIFNSLVSLVTHSRIYGLLSSCNNKFNNSVNNSRIISACTNENNAEDKFADRYGRFLNKLATVVNKLFLPLKNSIDQSYIVKHFNKFFSNLLNVPFKYFGLLLLSWGIIGFSLSFVLFPGTVARIIYVTIIACGLFLLIMNKNISHLINGSAIIRFTSKLLGINLLISDKKIGYSYKGFVLTGGILGILSTIIGLIPVLLLIIAFVAVVISFKYTIFLCWVYICILPFMPTMVMVATGLGIFACVAFKTVVGYRDNLNSTSGSNNMLVLFMAVAFVISAIFSFERSSSVKIALVYLAFLCAIYAITKVFTTQKSIVVTLHGMSVFSIPVSLYGIYQHFTGFDKQNTWIDTEMFDEISGRVVSFFGNPNVFGEYLILAIIVSLICLFITDNYYVKSFHLIAVALSGISLIFTYSRGCWIGVVFAVAIFLFMSKRKLFAFFCVVAAVSVFFLPDSIITRISSVGNLGDSSTSYRVYIWEGTINMLKDFWVTGIGLGTDAFNAVYPLYAYSAISAPHPHNLYLLILSETGIIGITAFVMIITFFYKRLFIVAKKSCDKKLKIISSGLIAAMSGFLLQGMFDNVWYNYRIFLLFWIFVALGTVVDTISRRIKHEQN